MTTNTQQTDDVLREIEASIAPAKPEQTSEPAEAVSAVQEQARAPEHTPAPPREPVRAPQASEPPQPPPPLPPMGRPVSPGLREMAKRLERDAATIMAALRTFQDNVRQFNVALVQEQQRAPAYPPPPYGYPPHAPQGNGYPPYPHQHPQQGYGYPQHQGRPPSQGGDFDPTMNPFTPDGAAQYPGGFGYPSQGHPQNSGGDDYLGGSSQPLRQWSQTNGQKVPTQG